MPITCRAAIRPRLALLLAGAACLASCETLVPYRPNNWSAPTLQVSVLNASGLEAYYSDRVDGVRERVRTPIDTYLGRPRPFEINLRSDSHKVVLMFTATDRSSGIREGSVSLHASFRCLYGDGPFGVQRDATFPADFARQEMVRRGGTNLVPASGLTVIEVDLETLWKQGCRRQDGTLPRTGHVANLVFDRYFATAQNFESRIGAVEGGGILNVGHSAVVCEAPEPDC